MANKQSKLKSTVYWMLRPIVITKAIVDWKVSEEVVPPICFFILWLDCALIFHIPIYIWGVTRTGFSIYNFITLFPISFFLGLLVMCPLIILMGILRVFFYKEDDGKLVK